MNRNQYKLEPVWTGISMNWNQTEMESVWTGIVVNRNQCELKSATRATMSRQTNRFEEMSHRR